MATVFAAIGTAAAAAAPSVASFFGIGPGAAAGAGAAAASGSGVVTLSQILSAGSALAAIGQGFAAKKQASAEAAFANAQAAQEEAQGAAQARDLAREYAALTGEQKVIQLANGLDIGVGTPVNVAESTQRLAQRNLDVTRQTASNRSAMSRLRARGLMSEARASMLRGFGRAAQIGVDAYRRTA